MAAQQTVNALESVQGAVINNTFSADAGIDTNTALFKDDPQADSAKPFVNGFAVRRADRENETYKKVAALYHEQAALDGRVVHGFMTFKQVGCLHDHAGNAEAALHRAVVDELVLEHAQAVAVAN